MILAAFTYDRGIRLVPCSTSSVLLKSIRQRPGPTNLAIAFSQAIRLSEAEAAARRGIELGDTSAKADYVLAVIPIPQGQRTPEVVLRLHNAGNEFSRAR
jgi:hypothetical protein